MYIGLGLCERVVRVCECESVCLLPNPIITWYFICFFLIPSFFSFLLNCFQILRDIRQGLLQLSRDGRTGKHLAIFFLVIKTPTDEPHQIKINR